MKAIKEFLAELNSLNIRLRLEDGRLGLSAPKGVMTPVLQQKIAARKDELLALLQPQMPLPRVKADPSSRHEPFPLSDVQYAYWIGRGYHFELGNLSTKAYIELESSDLDHSRLNQAWQKLINRHEMLRTVVRPDGQQQILAHVPVYEMPFLDLSSADTAAADQKFGQVRQEMLEHVFQADRWPLFDIRLTRLNGKSRVHISIDALITDGWSMAILFQEWSRFYHQPEFDPSLPELSFRDYMIALKEIEAGNLYERSKKYWLDRLDTLPPAPDLPFARDPKTVEKPRFQSRRHRMNAALWQGLQKKAAKHGLRPSSLLLAAFAEALTWWSKSPHFTINLTLFNRLPIHPQVNEIVGDFTSIILLEVNNRITDSGDTFANRAKRIESRLWQDLDHRYFSGIQVIRHLNSRRRQSGSALMPIVFTNVLGVDQGREKPLGEEVYSVGQTSQVYIDHGVAESDGNLNLFWGTVAGIFPDGLTDDIFRSYVTFLEQLAVQEHIWTSTNPFLLPPARQEQRLKVNETQAPVSDELLHTLFTTQARRHPERIAVIGTDRTLTYGELYQHALQVSLWLRDRGAKPNQLVAVVMEKGWEQVAAVLGVLMSGAAYLPVDPELPAERRHYLLAQGDISLSLTQSKLDDTLIWPANIQRLCVDTARPDSGFKPEGFPEPVQTPGDLAYVIYTSGSTGQPKGVMIDHRGAVNTILDINRGFGVTEKDRVLALSALNFDLSVYDIFGLLAAGGTIVMPAPEGRRDPSHWAELMTRHGVTLWNTVPALMQMLTEYQDRQALNTSLRVVMMSGDWIPLDLPDRIRQLRTEAAVMSLGGATEASVWSICYPIEGVDPSWKSIPYGKPMTNQSFHVLNERLDPCPVWVPGQLYIGGVGLSLGYWQDKEKTDAVFFTHPRTGERLYKTGDLGRYLPDGNIEFLGREDFQVKIRGHRIELGEIEAHLLRHPHIKDAVVAAVGESRHDRQLAAYIVSDENSSDAGAGDQAAYGLQHTQGVLTDPVERMQFKLKQPGIRQFENDLPEVELPPVRAEDAAYLARQSYRRFLSEPVSLSRLGGLLGCLSPRMFPNTALPKYRYGSAGSLYPVQTYLYIEPDRVSDLAGGFYYYHPGCHRLFLLSSDTALIRELHGGTNRTVAEQSAFSIFLAAEYRAVETMYGAAARDFCLLEAGYMSQLLMTEAPEHDLGLCPIGGMDFEPLRAGFGLTDSQEMIHSFLGGGISADQKERLYYIPPQTESPEEQLKSYLAQKLPGYMVPNIYIRLPELPLTANGKINRKALPHPDLNRQKAEFVPPGNETEHRLVGLVQKILETEKPVSVTDNFFDLGANSLLMVQLYNEIKAAFQREITIRDIFNHASVHQLAEVLITRAPEKITAPSADAVIASDLNPEQIDRLSANLDNLSDAEVEELLGQLRIEN